ncbi:NUDIX hydrolase [Variovorax sp. HJSM1_2]|uniref:NUDIX hydrolase n=1 Tax=Variovorax sp. HJSM1_2 TaxID=3366263 RepID=UPI003BCEF29C
MSGFADAEVAAWLARLRSSAEQPPLRVRLPLWAGAAQIGSVEPEFIAKICLSGMVDLRELLLNEERDGVAGWRLAGEPMATLAYLANVLREAGLAHAWRNEQLAVPDAHGQRIATVERAVVRGLGITTQAVHLLGIAPDGRHWVQQRAFNKPNDPGLWDTLMGGMVSAADSVDTALVRETWEEAGLHVEQLTDVRPGGRLTIRRPTSDCAGAGYVVEHIAWFVATIPEHLTPQNQDGEVEQFVLMERDTLWQKMLRGEFTSEAALIQAAYFEMAQV